MITKQIEIVCELKSRVRNYTRKQQYFWNWSCDVCGDSKSKLHRARFYVSKRDNNLMCYCHNCNYAGTFAMYTRLKHPDLYQRISQNNFITKVVDMFDYNTIMNRKGMTDDILSEIFFIKKFKNEEQYRTFLARKHILLTEKNLEKLINIFKKRLL